MKSTLWECLREAEQKNGISSIYLISNKEQLTPHYKNSESVNHRKKIHLQRLSGHLWVLLDADIVLLKENL